MSRQGTSFSSTRPFNNGYRNNMRGNARAYYGHSNGYQRQPSASSSQLVYAQDTDIDEQPSFISDVDETRLYAVNLQLSPVEMGIIGKNTRRKQQFKGLGAFNQYFGLLFPANGAGYTLCDVWDGYFHITLAQFSTTLEPHDLDAVFKSYNPTTAIPYIPETVFEASHLAIHPGKNRAKDRKMIDFVVLPIETTVGVQQLYSQMKPLLNEIQRKAACSNWYETPIEKLHVTLRKYSNPSMNIQSFPMDRFSLEFGCSHIEVKQTRDQAVRRYKEERKYRRNYQWWNGAADIDGKCSVCQTAIAPSGWEGFCFVCGQYESIVPVWSSSGSKTGKTNTSRGQIDGDDNTDGLIQRINSMKV